MFFDKSNLNYSDCRQLSRKSFMTRAGREPAEDVKRRLIAICEELGQPATGMMRLIGDVRLIVIDTPTVGLIAHVPISGSWPETIDVRCGTPDGINGPWLQGRTFTPFDNLLSEIRETLNEQEKVIAAMQLGIEGPYCFERSVWKKSGL
jgi:hypothetical protein